MVKKTPSQQILANQKKILAKLDLLTREAEQELAKENEIEDIEKQELKELHKLEALEKQLEKDVHTSPLKRITYRDFSKSAVGACFGILGHFSFFYGVRIAEDISMTRATILYLVAFFIGALFLYFTGFRKVETTKMFKLIPMRLFVIFFTSVAIVIAVLYLFNFINASMPFSQVYKSVATVSVLAVIGAATADLIGKEE